MNESLLELSKKIQTIINQGWIKSERCGSTGIGYTLEKLLDIKENNSNFPDFNLIEIKTSRYQKNGWLTMFCSNPINENNLEIKYLQERFGYPDKLLKNYKVINEDIYCNQLGNLGAMYKWKLKLDNKKEIIQIIILDNNLNIIDNNFFWTYDQIESLFKIKMQNLIFFKMQNKTIQNEEYFKISQIKICKFKNFDNFLKLIEAGKIKITFTLGIFKSGARYGQIHNHGTAFRINNKYFDELFDTIWFNL